MDKFSIVVPVYFNEQNLPFTVPRLLSLENIISDVDLELIFVDDGSLDNSFSELLNWRKKDNRIKVIKLSKNFGSMSAVMAGIQYATGDCVGIISADLQDPPELFFDMIKHWRNGHKVVLATRQDRQESFMQKLFSNTYYSMMKKFAIKDYPSGGFDFVLVDRQVINELKEINEKNTNVMSLIFWLGHDRKIIPYVRQERKVGKSRWTLSKKIKLFIDSFVSFSFAPIRFMSMMGILTSLVSFIYGIIIICGALIGYSSVKGWPTLITLMSFFMGLIMFMLGVIGEYLWRILDEVRKRPGYVVDKVFFDDK